ncbi:MAG: type II secretion system F family protein, partial [Armatimonadota bacterium]|nr:type II secretion system F family protein [Armatimonadota bacterium]
VPLEMPAPKHLGGKATVKEFLDYVARYDETFKQYGYFARAVTEVNPSFVATTGSFGSSPGVGARGGWPWATIPGQPIYEGMPVQQAYDWNELPSSKPMHLAALIDRLRSYYPNKTTWALVDDFKLFFGREARQRAYALALTRGVQAIGTTFLAAPTGDEAKPQIIAEQKELFDWIHKYGGAYAMTEPLPSIGILYVHQQALLRRTNQNAKASDEELFNGSHEGKTTEALFLCHAAGWPAKIVTPEELVRSSGVSRVAGGADGAGAPTTNVKAILLVGLNRFDDSWAWYEGLAPALQKFVQGGGRILLDHESVVPDGITVTSTGMKVRAYITQSDVDLSPQLLARNADNIAKLRAAMQDVVPPLVASNDLTIWAVPTIAGDVQYATVVNWGYEAGKNASQVVKPQTGTLTWNTNRPIYDVRLGRKLSPEEARTVDLTQDGFRWYALPPAEITAPKVEITRGASSDRYYARPRLANPQPMHGIPVQVTVAKDNDAVTLYGVTGRWMSLPLTAGVTTGSYTFTVKELLSGLSSSTTVTIDDEPATPVAAPMMSQNQRGLIQFALRKDVPLVVALTPEQAKDAKIQQLAQRLVGYYSTKGRKAEIGSIEPNGVVLSLQPLSVTQRYPQWRTIKADLVLLGNPTNNVLLLDQMRGNLLPVGATPGPGQALLHVAYSPFVGEYNVANIIAPDTAGLEAGVTELTSLTKVTGSPQVKAEEVVKFTLQLQQAIENGQSLRSTLETLAQKQPNKHFRQMLEQVFQDVVVKGYTLSGAMARHPDVFNAGCVAVVRAGETNGNLDETLLLLAK